LFYKTKHMTGRIDPGIDFWRDAVKLLSRSEEYVLLAVWKQSGNAYTLTILEEVSRMTGYAWQVGTIHGPLEKLARKGYLRRIRTAPTPERGGRSKFLYELTGSGRKALKSIREIQVSAWAGVSDSALD
jgi:DNA-binding PadR family transcriptional regulator